MTAPTLDSALAKLDAATVPQARKVALAYSGGLDSALCAVLARERYGAAEVVPITVDLGQGEAALAAGQARAAQLGLTPLVIDGRSEFSEVWLKKAIRANADYNGYPCATALARQFLAALVAQQALELGCDALMDGSSGTDNEQYRLHNVFTLFAPRLPALVPVRDFGLTRAERLALCDHYGIPTNGAPGEGEDRTLWCHALAVSDLGLDTALPADAWLWWTPPAEAPAEPATLTITFEAGVPTRLDGRPLPLKELVPHLNELGGAHGVGKLDLWEDGIVDLKSRAVYEAPAAAILLKLHRDLEGFCLTKDEIAFKRLVEQRWAALVYDGEWFHPLRADLDAFIAQTQGVVNGEYTIALYKGNVEIVARHSPTSLFSPETRALAAASAGQQLAGPVAQVRGLPYEVLAKRNAALRATWQ